MSLALIAKVQKLKRLKTDRRALRKKGQAKKQSTSQEVTPAALLPHTPQWAVPYFKPARFKAVFSGRAGGKSHFFAELMLARMVCEPDLQCVCIRRYRVTLTNSVMLLLKNKICDLGWDEYFVVQQTQIKRKDGRGFIAFIGMQDHNATSIKGYEGFGIAWVDEAAELDQYSLDLLIPTLRKQGAETWFTWNPEQPEDPVDAFFRGDNPPENAIVKGISFADNPFLSDTAKEDEQRDRLVDPEKHEWMWLGGYNLKSNAIVFAGKWRIAEVDTTEWDGPYYGADWGFAADPTAAGEVWASGNQIYISRESYAYRLESDRIAYQWQHDIPGMEEHTIRGDNARPETISLVCRSGYNGLIGCEKWKGSVEDGIDWLRGHEILVHPDCVNTQTELKRYRYKQNRGGDVLPQLVDKDNHMIDVIRYALEPLIKNRVRDATPATASVVNRGADVTRFNQNRKGFGR